MVRVSGIFFGLSIYMIVSGLITIAAISTLNDPSGQTNIPIGNSSLDESRNGIFSNASILWDLITLNADAVGSGNVIVFFIFWTIPMIIWWICLGILIFHGDG